MDRKTGFGLLLILLSGACGESTESLDNSELIAVSGKLDSWMAAGNMTVMRPSPEPAATKSVAPVTDLLTGLEERLRQNPNDVKGWSLLAQSYAFVGRMEDARAASERAVELGAAPDAMRSKILSAHSGTVR